MAVGLPAKTTYANGDVFSASDINDTNGTLNLVGQTTNFYAGKNKIINGDFKINQRAFTSATAGGYGFDRFANQISGSTGTATFSTQTFTPGTAPVAGYEGSNYLRIVTTGQTATSTITRVEQAIEDVRTFAGQTATFSFWAKAASGTPSVSLELSQGYGSGGSPSSALNIVGGNVTLSTSWARYSVTVAVPSLSGKTLGTTANTSTLIVRLWVSAGSDFNARTGSLGIQTNTFEFWGIQAEAGSTATAFQTATGTIQGELAACQRYYQRFDAATAEPLSANGGSLTTTISQVEVVFPVQLRTAPSSLDSSNVEVLNYGNNTAYSGGTLAINLSTKSAMQLRYTHGSAVFTAGNVVHFRSSAGTGYLGWSAEL
jgi:hypothetical protein